MFNMATIGVCSASEQKCCRGFATEGVTDAIIQIKSLI